MHRERDKENYKFLFTSRLTSLPIHQRRPNPIDAKLIHRLLFLDLPFISLGKVCTTHLFALVSLSAKANEQIGSLRVFASIIAIMTFHRSEVNRHTKKAERRH